MDLASWIRHVQAQGGLQPAASSSRAAEDASPLWLVVGLGNPGREYEGTRHNAGFMVVDALARALGTEFRRMRHKALLAEARVGRDRVVLAKPQTYMNLSGQAVGPLVRFYKLPLERMLVVYDDLDLPFGALRLRPRGGHGGHKGMRSIIEALGGRQDFPRLRVGIGRPPGRMRAADYVLQRFRPEEREAWPWIEARAVEGIQRWMREGIEAAMNWLNPWRLPQTHA